MRNPYRVSGYVTGVEFYGREQLSADIGGTQGGATYIIGMRQMGKTSLLLQLLCHELFDNGRLRPLQDPDVDAVLTRVRPLGIFDADFDHLSAAERCLPRAVLEMGWATGDDLSGVADASFLHGLSTLGYLRHSGDGYAIGNTFLARWLQAAPWEKKSDVSDQATRRLYYRTALWQAIVRRFDLEELRTLCVDVGVNYDILRGEGLEAKIRELVAHLERRDKLERLVAAVRAQRPGVI